MKRRLTAFLWIFVLIPGLILNPAKVQASEATKASEESWPQGPSVYADAAIVMEASTGLVLYEKNINHKYYPASITKIMTSLLAIENSSLSDVVTMSKNAIFDVDQDSTRIGVDVGEQLTLLQCLYAILLASDNQISYAVAEHVAGTIPAFADMMNEKAKSIGCINTHFANPHGLQDSNHYTSAYDMALITREAMKNVTFRKIFGTRTYQIPPTNLQSESRPLSNHHKFVKREGYFYDDCIGGKTGFTSDAKYTLVSVAKRGDLELICIIMHDDSDKHQYTDTQKLFNFAFDNFSIYPIHNLKSSEVLTESPFFTRFNSLLSTDQSPIATADNGYLILPNTASFDDAKREVTFSSDSKESSDTDNSSADSVIGKISYTYNGKYVGGANILYKKTNSLSLVQKGLKENNPTAGLGSISSSGKSGGSLRPFIIGGVAGLFILIVGLYYFLVERPRLKRRHAYYRKRANRKLYHDDDYLDL